MGHMEQSVPRHHGDLISGSAEKTTQKNSRRLPEQREGVPAVFLRVNRGGYFAGGVSGTTTVSAKSFTLPSGMISNAS